MMTGDDAIDWIEEFCRVPKGPGAGNPIRLLDFQKSILRGIFDTPTRRAIVSMGRQNGKTLLAACLLLLHLCGPRAQRNGLVISSALTKEQASIVFDLACKMIRASPALAAAIVVVEFQRVLKCPALGTTYRALSADAPAQLGLSPFFVVHDELGQVRGPSSDLYEVLESGSAAQIDPLSVIISTQAPDNAALLSQLIDDAKTGRDSTTKLFLWTSPDEQDYLSEQAWYAANPALGHFLRIDEIRSRAEQASFPGREGSFLNLH